MVGTKTLTGFRHVLDHWDCYFADFIFRTNSSTYVMLDRLRDFVQTIPRTGYYGGFLGEHDGQPFVGGTGILISTDLAQRAVDDPKWEYDLIDDVALGRSMSRLGVEPVPLPRVDIPDAAKLSGLDLDSLDGAFMVRCTARNGDRSHDVRVMHRVHTILKQTTGAEPSIAASVGADDPNAPDPPPASR